MTLKAVFMNPRPLAPVMMAIFALWMIVARRANALEILGIVTITGVPLETAVILLLASVSAPMTHPVVRILLVTDSCLRLCLHGLITTIKSGARRLVIH